MIAWPSSRSCMILSSSRCVSASDSAVVGSSKMITRGDSPRTFAISPDRAREDLDERALAGPVLAGEAHDLAGPQVEIDVGQRLVRAVGLRRAAQRHDGLGRGRRRARALGGRRAHDCALAVGGFSSGLTVGSFRLSFVATTAPGSSFGGGCEPTAAMPASITPW